MWFCNRKNLLFFFFFFFSFPKNLCPFFFVFFVFKIYCGRKPISSSRIASCWVSAGSSCAPATIICPSEVSLIAMLCSPASTHDSGLGLLSLKTWHDSRLAADSSVVSQDAASLMTQDQALFMTQDRASLATHNSTGEEEG